MRLTADNGSLNIKPTRDGKARNDLANRLLDAACTPVK
jgi:hypothetical protein